MGNIQWWRSWHDAPMDHKWSVIAARSCVKAGIVSAIAWALMDYASQANPRGSVKGFDTEMYSVFSGFEEVEIVAVIQAMTDKGIIDEDGNLTNWKKRQPDREDDSSERVARFREMKRNVTQCNAEKRLRERVDKDKDTDKERDGSTPLTDSEAVQQAIEEITGLPGGNVSSIKAIDEIVGMQPIYADIQVGYQWLCDNGKTMKYYSQLVGPTRTAQSKRIQKANENKGKRETADVSGYTRA